MQKWEYAVMTWSGDGPEDKRRVLFTSDDGDWDPIRAGAFYPTLDRLGDGGWEMVHGNEPGTQLFFKRPKQEANRDPD